MLLLWPQLLPLASVCREEKKKGKCKSSRTGLVVPLFFFTVNAESRNRGPHARRMRVRRGGRRAAALPRRPSRERVRCKRWRQGDAAGAGPRASGCAHAHPVPAPLSDRAPHDSTDA